MKKKEKRKLEMENDKDEGKYVVVETRNRRLSNRIKLSVEVRESYMPENSWFFWAIIRQHTGYTQPSITTLYV